VSERTTAAIARWYSKHDVFRQVLVHGAEPVTDPGAKGWMIQFARVSPLFAR
jgi:hypothetical protein